MGEAAGNQSKTHRVWGWLWVEIVVVGILGKCFSWGMSTNMGH